MGDKYEKPLVSRRAALRGAAVGTAVVWVAPAVQVLSMTSAQAASGPPGSVGEPSREAGTTTAGTGRSPDARHRRPEPLRRPKPKQGEPDEQ